MLFTSLLLSAAALTASALPTEQKRALSPDARFSLTATSPAAVQNLKVLASRSSLFLGTKGEDAVCDPAEPWNTPFPAGEQFAIFYLNDGELRLYTAQHTAYTVFVDRSGMGQGAVGYVTRNNPLPSRWETHGWALNANNEVQFDGKGLLACPGAHAGAWPAWSVRLQGFESNPNWSQCVPVVAVANQIDHAIACEYTASS